MAKKAKSKEWWPLEDKNLHHVWKSLKIAEDALQVLGEALENYQAEANKQVKALRKAKP